MINSLTIIAISCFIVVCVYELITRPPLVEIDEDDMMAFIKEQALANTTKVYTVYKPVAMQRETESYYDRYRRLVDAKENDN